MKTIFLVMVSLLFSLVAAAQQSHQMQMHTLAQSLNSDTLTIAVLMYPKVVLQDFAGPIAVFSKARKLTYGKYRVFTVGLSTEKIATENDIVTLVPDYSLKKMPRADYLIIPGASMPVINRLMQNKQLKNFITHYSRQPRTTTASVCTGAYLLANAGLLDRRKATTHYFVADDFSQLFPKTELIKDVRFVDAGNYITSSGITSGIDAALYIVGQHSDERIRAMISRALQYNYHQTKPWPVAPHGMKYEREE